MKFDENILKQALGFTEEDFEKFERYLLASMKKYHFVFIPVPFMLFRWKSDIGSSPQEERAYSRTEALMQFYWLVKKHEEEEKMKNKDEDFRDDNIRSGKEFLFRARGYYQEGVSHENIKADILEKLTSKVRDLVFWTKDEDGWICSLFARTPQSDEDDCIMMLQEETQEFFEETIRKALHDVEIEEGRHLTSNEIAHALCLELKRKGYEIGVKRNHKHVTESTDL